METRLIGKIVSRRFRIEEVIGRGGMSLVYRAFDLKTHQTVAVKVLREEYEDDKEYRERFEREADVCKRLNHPNIVNLVSAGTAGGISYIAMEYVDGQTLKEIIEERKHLPQEEAVHYALQILAALGQAHQRGVVHRDVKPQNMLVTKNGQLKVTDFGIAGIAESETLTTDGTVIGSVHYFSPEQAKGMRATAASDLYSVGIIMYEMLSGRVPFNGESAVSVAMMHLMQDPEPIESLATVSPAIAGIVRKALEKTVQNRYQSADDMTRDLRRALRHPDGLFLEQPSHQVPIPRFILSPLVAAIILLLVVAIGLTGYQLYRTVYVLTTVPEVTGMMVEDAANNLAYLGLNSNVVYAYTELPENLVVSQAPEANIQLKKGEQVTLTVSMGSETINIPNFVGFLLNEALDIAAAQGFKVTNTIIEHSNRQKGSVIEQFPAAGEPTVVGSAISLVVSGGQVNVPELTGIRLEEARQRIKEVGLTMGQVREVETEAVRQDGIVSAQSLDALEAVLPGSIVDLEVWKYERRKYTSTVILDLSGVTDESVIRVTLLESDGNEYEMYNRQKESDYLEVDLLSETSGLKSYRLYIDGNFVREASAVLR